MLEKSRTQKLPDTLLSDNSSILDSENSDQVGTIVSPNLRTSTEEILSSELTEYSIQDNAELIHSGKTTREALEVTSLRQTAEQKPVDHAISSPRKIQGWVPKGQIVTVADREIKGMIYVGAPPKVRSYEYDERCRAYINPSLSVTSFGSDKSGDGMPYRPGYANISAACRATYLDWLAGDRQDGTINPGYMFLFFYGLERRFLVDRPSDDEKHEIVEEVERLKTLFSHSDAAQRYLGEFLDIARAAAMRGISLANPALKQTILENRSWDLPFSLKLVLGGMIAGDKAFDAEWLYLWLLCHPERRLRTPAERCNEEFKALFKLKFNALYPMA